MSDSGGLPRPPLSQSWPVAGTGVQPPPPPRPENRLRRGLAATGFLLDALRRRRGGRIVLWTLVVGMAAGGIGLLAYPFATNLWADQIQDRLEQEFRTVAAEQPVAGFREHLAEGAALTRLVIPKLKVDVIVVEGTSGNALRAGAGHYRGTALPGDASGNVAIAGHRTGFGQPFRHVDKLRAGDTLLLVTSFGRFEYEVTGPFDGHANPWVTHARDFTVIQPTPHPSLTLTTCDPPGTSKNRLIVRARFVGQTPVIKGR